MNGSSPSILLIAYGNPGRQDDGLGPELAERLAKLQLANIEIDSDYQLTVEHALDISRVDVVIFVDATKEDIEPYYFRPLTFDESATDLGFSTHSISPQAVLKLSDELFASKAKAYILGIRGYEFLQIEEGLSALAISNLNQAEMFIKTLLQSGDISLLELAACQSDDSGCMDANLDNQHA